MFLHDHLNFFLLFLQIIICYKCTQFMVHLTGAFRVEMQRESQKDRTILCKYDPTEPGDYRMEVKWSGEHVPGSPFMVMIFDTQDELNRYMAVSTLKFMLVCDYHVLLVFCFSPVVEAARIPSPEILIRIHYLLFRVVILQMEVVVPRVTTMVALAMALPMVQ